MADKLIQLGAGDYTVRDVVADTTSTVTVPVLTAGSIVEATPSVGDTLTVTGSNATAASTFQWQDSTDGSTGWANITGATAATLDTTALPAKFYRRGVTGLTQGPVYTAAVEVTAVATPTLVFSDDFVGYTPDGIIPNQTADWVHLYQVNNGRLYASGVADGVGCQMSGQSTSNARVYAVYSGAIANDQKANLTLTDLYTNTSAATFGVVCRAANSAGADGYEYFYSYHQNLITLARRKAGVETVLGTSAAHTVTTGDVLALSTVTEGGDVRLIGTVNGVETHNILDNSADKLLTGQVGIYSYKNSGATRLRATLFTCEEV